MTDLFAPIDAGRWSRPEGAGSASAPVRTGDLFPLSFSQQPLWLFQQLEPGSAVYNVPFAVRLQGRLDAAALQASIDDIRRRHEVLQVSFVTTADQPLQRIDADRQIPLPLVDLTHLPLGEREAEAIRLAADEARRPFDLTRGPLLRTTLLKLADDDHFLLRTIHHTIGDGWSVALFLRELAAFYNARVRNEAPPHLPPVASFGEMAAAQQQRLRGELLETQLAWWKQRLAGELPRLSLPYDHPSPARRTFAGERVDVNFDVGLTSALRELGREQRCTLYVTLLAAFNALLSRYGGQEDLLVGSPIAGRMRPETRNIIGPFINTLLLRTDASGDPTFVDFLERVRNVALDAFAHQDAPFGTLLAELNSPGGRDDHSLVQAMLVLEPPQADEDLEGLTRTPLPIDTGTSRFDLTLQLVEQAGGLSGYFEFSTELFDRETIERLAGHFQVLLEAIVANPQRQLSRLPLMTEDERRRVLRSLNDTRVDTPIHRCMHELFAEQADRTPDAVAIICGSQQLTYRELNRRANHMARELRRMGVGRETLVGICVERSAEMVVGLLGILKAGGAYLPLDPHYPPRRLEFMLQDSGAALLLTQSHLLTRFDTTSVRAVCLDELPANDGGAMWHGQETVPQRGQETVPQRGQETVPQRGQETVPQRGHRYVPAPGLRKDSSPGHPTAQVVCLDALPATDGDATWHGQETVPQREAPPDGAMADDLAYVIYTSGSTGQPKGVEIGHRALTNLLCSMQREPGLDAGDVLLAVTTLSFDIAALELFLPLIVGAKLVVVDDDVARDGVRLASAARQSGATFIQTTPARWRLILEAGAFPRGLKILSGGEPLTRELADQLLELSTSVWNVYGPTETTIWSTCSRVEPVTVTPTLSQRERESVSIGRPIDNTTAYVLDQHRQPVPVGVAGELYLGGTGVARGYRRRPELTAERFLPDPFADDPGARIYRTGDLARLRADGSLECLGRVDQQFKIRGVRIDGGEIEATLCAHPGVRQAAVAARKDSAGEQRLIAYIVAADEAAPPESDLREHLRESLPRDMIPALFVSLEALPLTPNGKVDRAALPDPGTATEATRPAGRRPETPTERALASFWGELLQVEVHDVNDHFFELGGHSLLAARLAARVQAQWNIELPLRTLFDAPTLQQQAVHIEARLEKPVLSKKPGCFAARQRGERIPLSPGQRQLWLHEQLEPGLPLYHIPWAARLRGPLDAEVVACALNAVIARHETLRTTFHAADGEPYQRIAPHLELTLPTDDLSRVPPGERNAEATRRTIAEHCQSFDLENGPLIRARLLRLDADEHVLLITLHHLISDDWSLGVLQRELSLAYSRLEADRKPNTGGVAGAGGFPKPRWPLDRGFPAVQPRPPDAEQRPSIALGEGWGEGDAQKVLGDLPLQFADWTRAANEQIDGGRLDSLLDYWKQKLAAAPPRLELPADFPRPTERERRGEACALHLTGELTAALETLSRSRSASLFMTLLAAFNVLLSRLSGETDLVVGAPVAGRQNETEGLIGFFVNTLALRCDLSGDPTFSELLDRVRETALDAFAQQDLPFEKLIEELQPERPQNASPLFQVMLNVLNAEEQPLELAGVTAELLAPPELYAKFDLTLYARQRSGELKLMLVYDAGLFHRRRVEEMLRQLEQLLRAVVENPAIRIGDLSLVTDQARRTLPDAAAALLARPCAAVHELFRRQAARVPDRIAVDDAHVRFTYAELNCLSDRLARRLVAEGIAAGDIVAIQGERCASLVWALLGVLKAGAAFAILDPQYPAARLERCLAAAGAVGLIRIEAADAQIAAPLASPDVRVRVALPQCRSVSPKPTTDGERAFCTSVGGFSAAEILPEASGQSTKGTRQISRHALASGSSAAAIEPGASALRLMNNAGERTMQGAGPSPCFCACGLEAVPLPGGEGEMLPAVDADAPACVAFTSGTSGEPKAILSTHRPLSHFLEWHASQFELTGSDRFCLLSGLSHDPALRDIFTPLSLGGTLHIPDRSDIAAGRLCDWLQRAAVSVLHITPAVSQLLAGGSGSLSALRYVFFGGDSLARSTIEALRRIAPQAVLVNFYGATETPQAAAWYRVPDLNSSTVLFSARDRIPIGRGIRGTQLLVLNAAGTLAGIGEPGEIHVRTPHLSRGYINDEALTAARFVANSHTGDPHDRLYKTGDCGRYLLGGAVECLGRIDGQINLRGVRIEPGEIVAALRRHPGVRDAVVGLDETGERLAAWVLADAASPPDRRELRQFLLAHLPPSLVPAQFFFIDRFPLTPNGKIDRPALLAECSPPAAEISSDGEICKLTRTARQIAVIWQDELEIDTVEPFDTFVDLGGHSLLAMQVIARLERELRVPVAPQELLFQPLCQLAAVCDERLAERRSKRGSMMPRRVRRFILAVWKRVRMPLM